MITHCSLGHPLGGSGCQNLSLWSKRKTLQLKAGHTAETPRELGFFCATVEQDRPGRLAEWGTWQCPHVSPKWQGYRWSCLVMKTSSRLNVRETSHSRFTWEKRRNGMEAVFPHSIGDVLCSEVTPPKFLCWYSAANVTLLKVGVLKDSCSGGGSSHMWGKGPFRGCSWFLFCQCDIRGVNWRKGMLIEKIPHPIRLACGQSCEIIFLISNWCALSKQAPSQKQRENFTKHRTYQHLKLLSSKSERKKLIDLFLNLFLHFFKK